MVAAAFNYTGHLLYPNTPVAEEDAAGFRTGARMEVRPAAAAAAAAAAGGDLSSQQTTRRTIPQAAGSLQKPPRHLT